MKTNIDTRQKLEKVQRNCLNMCTEPVEMDTILGKFHSHKVEIYKVEIYKYVNNMYPNYFSTSRSSQEASSTV